MRVAMFEGYNGPGDAHRVAMANRRRLSGFGALVYTPDQMLDAANILASEHAKLDADIESSDAPTSYKTAWRSYLATWRAFYDSLQGASGYVKRLWGGTMEEIESYRSRLVAWQESFQRAGGTITGALAARPPVDVFASLLTVVKWAAIGGLALIVLSKVKR